MFVDFRTPRFHMWRLVLLAAVGGCHGIPRSIKGDISIVGGEPVSIKQVPYMLAVELVEAGLQVCGASIIGEHWALTAASCVSRKKPGDIQIRSDTEQKQKGGVVHKVVEIIFHDSFGTKTKDYDVAVVRVDTPFKKNSILKLAQSKPTTGTSAAVSGWGYTTETGSGSDHLRWVHVPIVDQELCISLNEPVGIPITKRMLCAGYPQGGKDSCKGDVGGPLVIDGKVQVGIVSKGHKCATAIPGVYTDVAEVAKWIKEKTGLSTIMASYGYVIVPDRLRFWR